MKKQISNILDRRKGNKMALLNQLLMAWFVIIVGFYVGLFCHSKEY